MGLSLTVNHNLFHYFSCQLLNKLWWVWHLAIGMQSKMDIQSMGVWWWDDIWMWLCDSNTFFVVKFKISAELKEHYSEWYLSNYKSCKVNQWPLQLLASKEGMEKYFINCTLGSSEGLELDSLLKTLPVDRWGHDKHGVKGIKNIFFNKNKVISQIFSFWKILPPLRLWGENKSHFLHYKDSVFMPL